MFIYLFYCFYIKKKKKKKPSLFENISLYAIYNHFHLSIIV